MTVQLVIQFLCLTLIVSGVIIFTLHRVFISSVEGAKQRLERDAEAARAREAELNRKIRQADEELAQRKRELDALELKMKGDLEVEADKHKDELLGKARKEAEEIITKAQNAADAIRRDVEKQLEIKVVDYSTRILDEVLARHAKGALERDLTEEFISQLQLVDMTKISPDIREAEVVTTFAMVDADLKKIVEIVRTKVGRDLQIVSKEESGHISGVVLRFGSLHLDGSLKTAIRDNAMALKTEIEKGYRDKQS